MDRSALVMVTIDPRPGRFQPSQPLQLLMSSEAPTVQWDSDEPYLQVTSNTRITPHRPTDTDDWVSPPVLSLDNTVLTWNRWN